MQALTCIFQQSKLLKQVIACDFSLENHGPLVYFLLVKKHPLVDGFELFRSSPELTSYDGEIV